jgi:hypothetical protein
MCSVVLVFMLEVLVVATSAVVGGTGRADGQAGGIARSANAAGFDIAVVASATESER